MTSAPEIWQLFGPFAEKRGFAQITLFRSKCSKMGQKLIGTIKNTKMIFDYITKKIALLAKKLPQVKNVPKLLFLVTLDSRKCLSKETFWGMIFQQHIE